MPISETIREFASEVFARCGMDPYHINCGDCEGFAMAVIRRLGGSSEELYELATDIESDYPGHVWIYFKGKHYDAECPDGVDKWDDLPLFKRYKAWLRGDLEYYCPTLDMFQLRDHELKDIDFPMNPIQLDLRERMVNRSVEYHGG